MFEKSKTFLTDRLSAVVRPQPAKPFLTEQIEPQELLVPQLVYERTASAPNATALCAGNEWVTYSELNRRATQLARYLRSFGVGPDTLVAICLERSIDQVAGSLGILKAGGAYLPMDPTYPTDRLMSMLSDARTPVLLTKQRYSAQLQNGPWRVINMDTDVARISGLRTDSLEGLISGRDLAYVIYTSGSTGQAKGVEITHKNLLNLVQWHQQAFDIRPTDRTTHLASPAFDASVWEVWPHLAAGANVFLPSDSIRNDPELLRDWIVAQHITVAFVATPIAERMIALDWPRETALRILLTGADTLHKYPPSQLPFVLINNYGPTECTVVASSGPVREQRQNGLPSIGRPIANAEIYLLDNQMAQVPDGAIGEIYIGGASVGRGYLNRPELTSERFVPNPFSKDANARLYRTGDLAHYFPDGEIAFAGRIDDQVKIRGYRVEPNEVTTVLRGHPMVQAGLVLAREEKPGDKRLVAYVVPKPGAEPTDKDLRGYVSNRLPDFMVPSVFVFIDSMPMNGNGKIDRASLPAPNQSNLIRDVEPVCARTPIEERVAALLAGLLHLERVGADDNFFLMGGNSLLGAQVIAKLRDAFGIELSLLSLFDNPTVVQLASEIERLLFSQLSAMTENEAEQLAASLGDGSNDGGNSPTL